MRGRAELESLGEIVIPHDLDAGPVTHVKNLVVQFSIAQLQNEGHYDRYAKLMSPAVLSDLLARLGPGWLPVEFAILHFEACDKLELSEEQIDQLARRVGDRIQNAALVSAAKRAREENFDVWDAVGQLHRGWKRLCQGGSIQITKLGPKEQLLSRRGYPMNRFRYYRQAQLGSFAAAYAALGTELIKREVVLVDAANDEVIFHLAWR